MCFVYAIKSVHRRYIYVGLSNNYQRRIKEHQNGKEKTTAPYSPFTLILIEEYKTRAEARRREKYLKSGCGKELLKNNNESNVYIHAAVAELADLPAEVST